jgi:serralysin
MCSICFNVEHLTSENAASIDPNLGDAGDYSNNYINGLIWGGGWSGPVYYTIDQGSYGGSGWTATQITAIQNAVASYNNVCGINISYVAPGNANVDIIFYTAPNSFFLGIGYGPGTLGFHQVPDGSNSEPLAGVYNYSLFSADTDSFDIGGYDYITLIHELGHGLGLAHPHDNGGSSSIFPGVTSSSGDYGDNNLNQGVFTTMSYNDGWKSQYPSHTDVGYGWQGTPMAFDIAALQVLYGANNSYQTGDNSYALPSYNQQNDNTYWSCIWDAGGTDRIYNPTSSSSIINLQEAPLTGANAGGYLSYVSGIKGGFTIANGVVIEKADGGSSTDTITGNSANNILNGNGGNDTIYGGGGNDTIDGGTGNDTMYGGGGDDTFKVDSSSDSVTENSSEGTDTVESSVTFTLGDNIENLTLTGASGNTNGTGNSLNNIIIGDGWYNILTGGDGNDTLNGGGTVYAGGQDTLSGGAGDDTYYVYAEGGGLTNIIEGANAGTDTIISTVSYNLDAYASHVENLTLTGGSEAKGNGLNNIITADSGSDTLYGYGGNDTLDGGGGHDTMIGGTGDDIYIVDSIFEVVTENSGEGTDTVRTSLMSLNLSDYTNVENLTLTGSSSYNLTGNSSNNTLTGNSGNNLIDGGAGGDTMIGGIGDDIFIVDDSYDVITEGSGEGTDTVRSSSISLNLSNYVNVENLTLTGSSNLNLTGNDSNNTLTCNTGNNIIDGNGGTDVVVFSDTKANVINSFGFHHSDTSSIIIKGSYGTDVIQNCEYITFSDQTISVSDLKNQYNPAAGGSGGQKMFTNNTSGEAPYVLASTYTGPVAWIDWEYIANDDGSVNVITGSDDDDFINVKNGTDAVDAGAGDDIIDGGLGSNFLTGGAGTDRFYIDGRVVGTTWSTVTDWDNSERLAVWGWKQGVSTREWVENLGAEGYKGATLRCDLDGDGTLDLRVTFTGYTSDQIKEPTEFPASELLWFV